MALAANQGLHNGLWIKFLDSGVTADQGARILTIEGAGEVLVGSQKPLKALDVVITSPDPSVLQMTGGRLDSLAATDSSSLRFNLDSPRARHPMWWTWDRYHLYRVGFETSNQSSVSIRMRPIREQ